MSRKRPTLTKGDVCRLHKKSRRFYRRFRNATFVVSHEPSLDSSEGSTLIQCHVTYSQRGHSATTKKTFKRRELWFTGYNAGDSGDETVNKKAERQMGQIVVANINQPTNNDGRTECYKCNRPTISKGGGAYQLCGNKSCIWYDN